MADWAKNGAKDIRQRIKQAKATGFLDAAHDIRVNIDGSNLHQCINIRLKNVAEKDVVKPVDSYVLGEEPWFTPYGRELSRQLHALVDDYLAEANGRHRFVNITIGCGHGIPDPR